MARTDRDVYRGTHKRDWSDHYHDETCFHGVVPSYAKRLVRKSERAAARAAMQRGDYDSAEVEARVGGLVAKNVWIINFF